MRFVILVMAITCSAVTASALAGPVVDTDDDTRYAVGTKPTKALKSDPRVARLADDPDLGNPWVALAATKRCIAAGQVSGMRKSGKVALKRAVRLCTESKDRHPVGVVMGSNQDGLTQVVAAVSPATTSLTLTGVNFSATLKPSRGARRIAYAVIQPGRSHDPADFMMTLALTMNFEDGSSLALSEPGTPAKGSDACDALQSLAFASESEVCA